jgi:peroxiredoxin
LPSINALHEEFKAHGLTVLLVNMRENREIVRRAVTTRRYTAPVVLDEDGEVADAYRVTGTPTVYILDRRLQIVGRAIGRRDWATDEGRRLLAVLLSASPGRRPAPRHRARDT